MTDSTHPPTPLLGTALVTGATGFTGGKLAHALLKRGTRVRALVRDAARARDLADAGAELVVGDLSDREVIDRAVQGCETVFHIAAVYRTANHSDLHYYTINRDAVGHLLDAARRHGVARLVHCSTVGVHGDVSRIPSDENAPYNPGDIYQHSKLAGEKLALEAITRGQPVVIFRPGAIYGPGDMRLFKLFKTIHDRTFTMFGPGTATYHLTYIDDLVDGIILCGHRPEAIGEVFILCGDEYLPLNELVRRIAQAVGVPPPKRRLPLWPLRAAAYACDWVCRPLRIDPPLHPRRVEFFAKSRAFTNAKARQLLGFDPKVTVEEGIRRTATWYLEQGLLKAQRNGARACVPLLAGMALGGLSKIGTVASFFA